MTGIEGHGGHHVVGALRARGVDRIFTLIGGHIFPVLDAATAHGVRLVDVRHEQAAAFAAEAHGKLARAPGVAVTDAGPGALNTPNALASALSNGSPMVLIAGRPPRTLWGHGLLNETEQLPVFVPITKRARTVESTDLIARRTTEALTLAETRHRGPVYLEITMDVILGEASVAGSGADGPARAETEGEIDDVAALLASAERPVLFIGSDVWADGAEHAARELAEKQRIPVIMNGMARGIVPAGHVLAFSGARSTALREADLVVAAGVPLDFRVGFGAFGGATVAHLADHPSRLARHAPLAAAVAGPLAGLLDALQGAPVRDRETWTDRLRAAEGERRAGYEAELGNTAMPIHPARVYGELVPRLARDAIVIADGGDFASYAGRFVDVYEPGGWLDPGPYGCLGTSAGYALAAGLLHPGRQMVVLLGDGAAGFSMPDWDTLVRFGVDVTFVCGNNAGWGLEKQPMRNLYGHDVAADLRPETRYDEVMRAFGGHGELVRAPDELAPALERALATQGPSLVNVLTDPEAVYPRGA